MQLKIGRVVKPHGIRGEVVVELSTDAPEERFAVGAVIRGKQGATERELTVRAARAHQGRLLVAFEEVPDRTAAEGLRGMTFFAAPREDDDGGFYDHQLVGLRVVRDGAEIGEVCAVHPGPAHNLLELTLGDGNTALVPFVQAIVPTVDMAGGTITITPPEGLLDLN